MDSYVIIKLLNKYSVSSDRQVIVNKCLSSDDGLTAFNNLSNAVNHFLKDELVFLGIIEFDKTVMRSVMAQELLMKYAPQSDPAIQIQSIASKIANNVHLANNGQKKVASR
jgi:flagellar biosynthesis protein FlhG